MTELFNYITWNPSEVIGHLGPITLRWYGMCWLVGIAGAYFMVRWLYKDQKIKDELFDPLFIYSFLGILLASMPVARIVTFASSPMLLSVEIPQMTSI